MSDGTPCEQHAREIGALHQAMSSGHGRFERIEEKIDRVCQILAGNGTKGYVARSIQNEEEIRRLQEELKEGWHTFREELSKVNKTLEEIAPMVRFSRKYVFLLAGFFGLLGGVAAEWGPACVKLIGVLI